MVETERRIQSYSRDIAENSPELEVRVTMKDVKIEEQKLIEWNNLSIPFSLLLRLVFQELGSQDFSYLEL